MIPFIKASSVISLEVMNHPNPNASLNLDDLVAAAQMSFMKYDKEHQPNNHREILWSTNASFAGDDKPLCGFLPKRVKNGKSGQSEAFIKKEENIPSICTHSLETSKMDMVDASACLLSDPNKNRPSASECVPSCEAQRRKEVAAFLRKTSIALSNEPKPTRVQTLPRQQQLKRKRGVGRFASSSLLYSVQYQRHFSREDVDGLLELADKWVKRLKRNDAFGHKK